MVILGWRALMARISRYDLPGVNAPLQELTRILRDAVQGRLNVAGEVTLEAGTTETLITDRDFGATTVLGFTPRSAAATLIVPYQTTTAKGEITIGHAAPGADVDYFYFAIG